MKVLKALGIVIIVIIVLVVVVSLFLPSKYDAENSIEVNAPAWTVFEEVNTLKNWDKWEPWSQMDPEAKVWYEGPEAGVGAERHWESEMRQVGNGKTVIAESIENESIKTELYFGGADEPNNGFWKFEETEGVTKVTWGFSSKLGFNPVFKIIMKLSNKKMQEQFNKGLGKLKEIAEAKDLTPKVEIKLEPFEAAKFIGIKEWVATPDFKEFFTRTYGAIGEFCGKNTIIPIGMPVAIYHDMNEAMDSFETSAAMPVALETEVEPEEGMAYVEIPAGQLVSAIHIGPYNTVGTTWEAVMAFVAENGLEENGPSWEVYMNDPEGIDESEIMTMICVPVK